jgi:molecular chaperone DnaK (HSP70)
MKRSHYGVGIDFGTTNSVVSFYDGFLKKTDPLTNKETNLPHPSVVWYRAGGSVIVGQEAKRNIMGFSNVEGNAFVSSVKRRLGKQESMDIMGEKMALHEVAAEIFKFLRMDAESRSSEYKVNEAIVTIPIYFDGRARGELRKAADRAGIFIKNFVHEPFAAIVGYCHREESGLQIENMEKQIILVFDWGGGTLDITLVEVLDNGLVELSTGSIPDRAGDHFDDKLAKFCRSSLLDDLGISQEGYSIPPGNMGRLYAECERAKISLSTKTEERVEVAGICKYRNQYQDMDVRVSRNEFNGLINNDINDAINEVLKTLENANVTVREVDQVLLIGGSSRIPLVRQGLREMFGHRIAEVKNANTIIAEGAAIIDAEGLQPVLARPLNVELSDETLFEVFGSGFVANSNVCRKKVHFFCTDNRDGEAKLVLKELAGRIAPTRRLTKEVLSIPVSSQLPQPYEHERVTVEFALDDDMVLHISGKGATQSKGSSCQIYDLCFGLRLWGEKDESKS